MSESDRTAIATAASTVDGVNVTAYYRQATRAGEGVVRLEAINYPNSFGGVCTWQVAITLPSDVVTAERWIESRTHALVDALSSELEIRSVVPVSLQLPEGGTIPCLLIEGLRAQNEQE